MGASFRTTISGMVCSGGYRGGARSARPLFLDETNPYLRVWMTATSPLTQGLNPALVWVVITGNQKLNWLLLALSTQTIP